MRTKSIFGALAILLCALQLQATVPVLYNGDFSGNAGPNTNYTGHNGLTNIQAPNLVGLIPSNTLNGVNGAGLTNLTPANFSAFSWDIAGPLVVTNTGTFLSNLLVSQGLSVHSITNSGTLIMTSDSGGQIIWTGHNASIYEGFAGQLELTSTVGINLSPGSGQAVAAVGGYFNGSGSGLTSLNASALSSGTVPLAQLSSVVLTNLNAGVVTLANNLTVVGSYNTDGSNIFSDGIGDLTVRTNLLGQNWSIIGSTTNPLYGVFSTFSNSLAISYYGMSGWSNYNGYPAGALTISGNGLTGAFSAKTVMVTNSVGTNNMAPNASTNIEAGVTNIVSSQGYTNWSSTYTNTGGCNALGMPWQTNSYAYGTNISYTTNLVIGPGTNWYVWNDATYATAVTSGAENVSINFTVVSDTNTANVFFVGNYACDFTKLSLTMTTHLTSATGSVSSPGTSCGAVNMNGSATVAQLGWTNSSGTNSLEVIAAVSVWLH